MNGGWTPGPWNIHAVMSTPEPRPCEELGDDFMFADTYIARGDKLIGEVRMQRGGKDTGFPSVECEREMLANAHLIVAAPELFDALEDALSGWRYIREQHGDLYGVGWERVETAARAALAKAKGEAQ